MKEALRQIVRLFPTAKGYAVGLVRVWPLLGGRLGSWVRQKDGSPGARLAVILGVCWLYAFAWSRYSVLGWLLLLAWLVIALPAAPGREGQEDAAVEPTVEPADDAPENDHENDQELGEKHEHIEPADPAAVQRAAEAAFVTFVEHNVAHAVQQGRKGVHTDVLLELLHRKKMLLDWKEPAFRAKCGQLRIPVRRQMSIKGRNYYGVHHEDLTRALGRRPVLPAHRVPDLTPGAPPLPTPDEPLTAPPALALVAPPPKAA